MANKYKCIKIVYMLSFVGVIFEVLFTVYYHAELWQYNMQPYEIKDYVSIILPIFLLLVNIIYLLKYKKISKHITIFNCILILLIPFKFEKLMLLFGALFGPFITID